MTSGRCIELTNGSGATVWPQNPPSFRWPHRPVGLREAAVVQTFTRGSRHPPAPCPAAPSVFPLGVSAQVTHTVQLCGRRFPASPALLFPGISADTASPAPSARVGSPGRARDSCACPGPSLWAPLLPGRFQWPPRTPSSRSQPLLATCLLDPPRSRS